MKYIIFFFIFILHFSSNAKDGVFFLDLDYLLNNSNYGKKIIQKLKKINDKNLIEIENYEKELKVEDDEINKVKNIISKDELNIRTNNFKKKISLYREKKNKIFSEYNDLKNSELNNFFNKISPFVEEFMENNSINIIIDKKNIFIANKNYDITNSLIEFLNLKLNDG